MIVHTDFRDCLSLNWALPLAELPPPPEPLRYEVHPWMDGAVVFVTALLGRQHALRTEAGRLPWIDSPQAQIHLCALDEEGTPSLLIRTVMVPVWLAPGARWVIRQPARAARMRFPRSLEGDTEWQWEVERGDRLIVRSTLETPGGGEGPKLGTWDETVGYFRHRTVAYFESLGVLKRVDVRRARSAVTPVRAEIADDRLLARCVTGSGTSRMPRLHSAWICSSMTVSYEPRARERSPVASGLPAPG